MCFIKSNVYPAALLQTFLKDRFLNFMEIHALRAISEFEILEARFEERGSFYDVPMLI